MTAESAKLMASRTTRKAMARGLLWLCMAVPALTAAQGPTTVSYAHRFSSAGINDDSASRIAVDAAGDTFGLFTGNITPPNSFAIVQQSSWNLLKLDPVGNLLWRQTITFAGLASPSTLYLDSSGNAYLGGTSFAADGTGSACFYKFDNQGGQVWSSSVIPVLGARDKVLALTANSAGACIAACEISQSSGKVALEMVSISSQGVATQFGIDTSMRPHHAAFVGANCIVSGEDNAAGSLGGSRWGLYSQKALMLFGGTSANTFNSSSGEYSLVSHALNSDSSGNVYVFTNTDAIGTSGSTTAMSNTTSCYNPSGQLLWTTAQEPGMVIYSSIGSSNYIYSLTSLAPGPLTISLNRHDHLGHLLWSKSTLGTLAAADANTGVFIGYARSQNLDFQKIDVNGNEVWSGAYTADTSYRNDSVVQLLASGGILHAIGTVSGPNGFLGAIGYGDALMLSVVEGIEVEWLDGPATITGGSTANLNVLLNAAATGSGLPVTLTIVGSSANFGGKSSITINLPAGQSHYTVPMNTSTVTSSQTVTVRAVCATSERDLSVTVTP